MRPQCVAEDEKSNEQLEQEAQEQAHAELNQQLGSLAGMPLITARVSNPHICPMVDVGTPLVGGPILPPGVLTVLIVNRPV